MSYVLGTPESISYWNLTSVLTEDEKIDRPKRWCVEISMDACQKLSNVLGGGKIALKQRVSNSYVISNLLNYGERGKIYSQMKGKIVAVQILSDKFWEFYVLLSNDEVLRKTENYWYQKSVGDSWYILWKVGLEKLTLTRGDGSKRCWGEAEINLLSNL